MALTLEWQKRIEWWRVELLKQCYRPLGTVALDGFVTRENLTVEAARGGQFKPMPEGTKWGAKWEYGWFRGEVVLPEEARGRRIVLQSETHWEGLIYLDGRVAGARDYGRRGPLMTARGEPGRRIEVLMEVYAGHGDRVCYPGPVPPERESVPEPPAAQMTLGETSFGVWEEEVYQLWVDVETLWQLRGVLDANLLRVAEIDAGLREMTCLVDFELSLEERLKTMVQGRARLKPLLECRNGTTAPVLFAFGHAHIDIAWLWPLAETERKAARTFSNQLALIDEYPEYRFLQSQPELYEMVRRTNPELYARVKEAVRAGQIVPDGAMWVEADVNLAGGEALVRQFLHGKKFYRDEFGVESEFCWIPDVFGYSGALPQIMRGCGAKYFATSKIMWNYNGGDPFPYNTFTWEGIDGTGVLVHLTNDYSSLTGPTHVAMRWNERVQKDGISSRLMPFGWGDGGGGATRDHLEFLRREGDLEGLPRTRMGTPMEFFHDLEARGVPEARYVGELYYQCHRGTYTSQAKTKKGNRKSEFALREAEMWSVAAGLKGFKFPAAEMEAAWKKLLVNQFHDILPGSSIHRVYEEAEAAFAEVITTAGRVTAGAVAALAKPGEAVTVLNSLNWERTALVELPAGWAGAKTTKNEEAATQQVGERTWAEVKTPSCGWTTLRRGQGGVEQQKKKTTHGQDARGTGETKASLRGLENELLRVEFNERGEITSLFDKETQREWAAGAGNQFRMYKDVPGQYDAWDIDSNYSLNPVELGEAAKVEVVAAGPLVARLRIARKLHDSEVVQEVSLRCGSRRVEFATRIDWQERHKLLKVAFPVNVQTTEGIHEIQFGHLRRPNHMSRPFDADRFEVCQHKWTAVAEEGRGFAVLNDCKYGVNVLGGTIALTLLRAPLGPDMTADRGVQEFTYAILPWTGSLADSAVVREAYELNVPAVTAAGDAGEASVFAVDAANVVIEAVKPAEDGSGDVIVRLYEAKRTATRCTLRTALPAKSAMRTDMLEREIVKLDVRDRAVTVELRAFEVATVRMRMG